MLQSGEPDNFKPFGNQAEGLYVFINIFIEKEGFFKFL